MYRYDWRGPILRHGLRSRRRFVHRDGRWSPRPRAVGGSDYEYKIVPVNTDDPTVITHGVVVGDGVTLEPPRKPYIVRARGRWKLRQPAPIDPVVGMTYHVYRATTNPGHGNPVWPRDFKKVGGPPPKRPVRDDKLFASILGTLGTFGHGVLSPPTDERADARWRDLLARGTARHAENKAARAAHHAPARRRR